MRVCATCQRALESAQYDQLVILQSSFRLAAQRRPGDGGSAFTAPVTESWIGRNRPPPLDFYGRCIAGRRHWRGSAGAVQAGCWPPAVGGDGREGGRAARREDRRRRSTVPATPGAAESAPGGRRCACHDESRMAGHAQAPTGWSIGCMLPAWQRGHWRNERPVSAS